MSNESILIDHMNLRTNNNTKICASCKQPGHSRASHKACPNNKHNRRDPILNNDNVCKSCKLVGHTRTSHRDCLHNKDRSENQIPELINMNVFCFV